MLKDRFRPRTWITGERVKSISRLQITYKNRPCPITLLTSLSSVVLHNVKETHTLYPHWRSVSVIRIIRKCVGANYNTKFIWRCFRLLCLIYKNYAQKSIGKPHVQYFFYKIGMLIFTRRKNTNDFYWSATYHWRLKRTINLKSISINIKGKVISINNIIKISNFSTQYY